MNKSEQAPEKYLEQERDPLDVTIETYRSGFNRYQELTPKEVSGEAKEWMDNFVSYLPENGSIFEIGSATGRDARYFSSQGCRVLCTDIIPEALGNLSKEGFETSDFDFRNEPKREWINKFDGFFANGVLLHAPVNILENALINVAKILKRDGVVAFSLKNGEGEEMTQEKMNAPRYFHYHNEEDVRNLLRKLPFEIVRIDNVENGKWLCFILKVRGEKN